jgi:hypothetical protein
VTAAGLGRPARPDGSERLKKLDEGYTDEGTGGVESNASSV